MLEMWPLKGIPEVAQGADLVQLVFDAAAGSLLDGDILVVTSKIVSKAEGRVVTADDREAAITAETVRLVASRVTPTGLLRIVQNRLGLVSAAAGVDASNTAQGTVLLLPKDPDASARRIAAGLRVAGTSVGVIISDTFGRPWREGQTDVAIGAAGMHVFDDLRGTPDCGGTPLAVTMPCVADELAAATDLVKGKTSGCPVAVVRGLGRLVGDLDLPGAASIARGADQDMFRLGTAEAEALGYERGYKAALAVHAQDGAAPSARRAPGPVAV